MSDVEPPSDPCLGDPVDDDTQIVVVDGELLSDRCARDEVHDGCHFEPPGHQLEELHDRAEHGVRRADRTVGDPEPEPRSTTAALGTLDRLRRRPECRLHQRSERLETGADDQDVLFCQIWLRFEQMQKCVPGHLGLAHLTEAGMELH